MAPESRAGNLFDPMPNAATHGNFDARAHSRSYQLWATTHRPLLAATAAAALAAAFAGTRSTNRR
jgi:hypothetical protein